MAYTLTFYPVCVGHPPDPHHPPPADKPLRVCVLGTLRAIQQISPELKWSSEISTDGSFLNEAGTHLSSLAFSAIYNRDPDQSRSGDFIFQGASYNLLKGSTLATAEASFEVIFDHLVPLTDTNPEVLQINIVDPEQKESNGRYLKITINPDDYKGSFIAVPRCCQTRIGSTDRARVNDLVQFDKTGII